MIDCDVPGSTNHMKLISALRFSGPKQHGKSGCKTMADPLSISLRLVALLRVSPWRLLHVQRRSNAHDEAVSSRNGTKGPSELYRPGLIRTDFAKVLWDGPRGQMISDMLPAKAGRT